MGRLGLAKSFHLFKGGMQRLTISANSITHMSRGGGGHKMFRAWDFPILYPYSMIGPFWKIN